MLVCERITSKPVIPSNAGDGRLPSTPHRHVSLFSPEAGGARAPVLFLCSLFRNALLAHATSCIRMQSKEQMQLQQQQRRLYKTQNWKCWSMGISAAKGCRLKAKTRGLERNLDANDLALWWLRNRHWWALHDHQISITDDLTQSQLTRAARQICLVPRLAVKENFFLKIAFLSLGISLLAL